MARGLVVIQVSMLRLCRLGLPLAFFPSDFRHEEVASIGNLENRGVVFGTAAAFVLLDVPEAGDDWEEGGIIRIVAVERIAIFELVFLAVRKRRAIRGVGSEP